MAKDYQTMAKLILEKAGGIENITSYTNCMTRLRLTLRTDIDPSVFKGIDGVIGAQKSGVEYQVILGSGVVNEVVKNIELITGVKPGTYDESKDVADVKQRAASVKSEMKNKYAIKGIFDVFCKHISRIFIPLIPGMCGAGLIAGLLNILQNCIVSAGYVSTYAPIYFGSWFRVLQFIQTGLFSYLFIFVGVNTAREFKGTEILGGIVAAGMMFPGFATKNDYFNVFNLVITAQMGGLIGVILAVYICCVLERLCRKFVPKSIDILLTPLLTLAVTMFLAVYVIMPISGFISNALIGAVTWLTNGTGFVSVISGFILALVFLPMVMLGLHQILTPIHLDLIQQYNYTSLLPILAMAGGGQVGAALAVWVRSAKLGNKRLINNLKASVPVGFMGVGEPLIYGISLPLGRVFFTACLGAAFGGAVIGLCNAMGHVVGAIAVGPSGIALIPLIYGNMWWGYCIGLLVSYVFGFIFTFFFGYKKEAALNY